MSKMTRNEKIAAYYGDGYSMRETAKRFGLSLERIRQILRAHFPHLIRPPHDTRQNSTGLAAGYR